METGNHSKYMHVLIYLHVKNRAHPTMWDMDIYVGLIKKKVHYCIQICYTMYTCVHCIQLTQNFQYVVLNHSRTLIIARAISDLLDAISIQ